jgi:putative ABC transport system substrate-binding protein
MRRRELILAAGAWGALASARTWAQGPGMRRVGVILYTPVKDLGPHVAEFRARLAKLGWSEGTNLGIEIWSAEGRVDPLPALVRQALARKVEVIVVQSTPAARAAKELAVGIPVVFTHVSDPVGSDVVASLARPGGHVTGTSLQFLEIAGKHIELLKALVPKLERVAWLHNPALGKIDVDASARYASAAARLGVGLMSLATDKAADVEPAFAAAARERIRAMVIGTSPISVSARERIVRLAGQHRIATVFAARTFVAAGGLASYGPDWVDSFARAASYVDRILRGAKPADLPVEQADRFELVINRKTAAELGLTIPQSLLVQATEVIE